MTIYKYYYFYQGLLDFFFFFSFSVFVSQLHYLMLLCLQDRNTVVWDLVNVSEACISSDLKKNE